MATMTRPVRFPGTADEIAANRATHSYDWEEGRCWGCDCRSTGTVATWPCGADVPRETITIEPEQTDAVIAQTLFGGGASHDDQGL